MGPERRDCSYSLGLHLVDGGKWYNKVFSRKFAKIPAPEKICKVCADFHMTCVFSTTLRLKLFELMSSLSRNECHDGLHNSIEVT